MFHLSFSYYAGHLSVNKRIVLAHQAGSVYVHGSMFMCE